jgi:hypothetical protein
VPLKWGLILVIVALHVGVAILAAMLRRWRRKRRAARRG